MKNVNRKDANLVASKHIKKHLKLLWMTFNRAYKWVIMMGGGRLGQRVKQMQSTVIEMLPNDHAYKITSVEKVQTSVRSVDR